MQPRSRPLSGHPGRSDGPVRPIHLLACFAVLAFGFAGQAGAGVDILYLAQKEAGTSPQKHRQDDRCRKSEECRADAPPPDHAPKHETICPSPPCEPNLVPEAPRTRGLRGGPHGPGGSPDD
jgi:hypothetical protein